MPELTPEEKQRVYLEEKARIEAATTAPVVQQKKKNSGCAVASFFLIVLVVIVYFQKDKILNLSDPTSNGPSSGSAYTPPPKRAQDNFSIKTNKYSVDSYGYYEVVGEVVNTSSSTFHFVMVKAVFYNKAGAAVGEDTTYASGQDFILPGGKKTFKFMGQNQSDYSTVRCTIEQATETR